jgi:hypothetical protein
MKIQTSEQLIDILAQDLAWRKRELSEVKSLIETKTFSEPKQKSIN